MAFLAVMREGLETAVFLLAAFNASGNAVAAGLGAVLGVVVAAAIGYGIYRGGVRSTWPGSSGSPGSCWCSSPRARRDRAPHGPRGRLDQHRSDPGARSEVAIDAGLGRSPRCSPARSASRPEHGRSRRRLSAVLVSMLMYGPGRAGPPSEDAAETRPTKWQAASSDAPLVTMRHRSRRTLPVHESRDCTSGSWPRGPDSQAEAEARAKAPGWPGARRSAREKPKSRLSWA